MDYALRHIEEIARLRAERVEGCQCVCHEFPEHSALQDALEANQWHAAEVMRLRVDLQTNATMLARQCDLAREAETLTARRKAALAQVEWGTWNFKFPRCPWCDQTKAKGHSPTCGLAAALAEEP